MAIQGFWSYVHNDDKAEGERITRLAKDVVEQFEMLTGEKISLFRDKDEINWGDNWRSKIDKSLSSVAFFIAVMTPRYFMSPECRRELQFFARRATDLGIKELVLPLHYVDVPLLRDDNPSDDLVSLAGTFQWEDWRDLRFEEASSAAYRKGVARLAARLVEANRRAEEVDVASKAQEIEEVIEEALDDSPGIIDRLAKTEETIPEWQETLEAISREINLIGQVMQEAAADINQGNAQGQGFASRLVVARRLARGLKEPTDRTSALGNKFVSQLHDVDEGVRIIIENAPSEIEQDLNSKEPLCSFFVAVHNVSAASRKALESVQGMVDAIVRVENMSRDLRPVLRQLRQGLTVMVEAREITEEWVSLIDKSKVACES